MQDGLSNVLSGSDRIHLAAGNAAAESVEIATKRTVENWLSIGRAIEILENGALHASGANRPVGKAYNRAYKELIADFPKLAELKDRDSATASQARWLYANRDEVLEWYGNLEPREQRQITHPKTIKRHFEKAQAEPADKEKPKRSKHPSAATLLQTELDRLRAYIIELEDQNSQLTTTIEAKDRTIERLEHALVALPAPQVSVEHVKDGVTIKSRDITDAIDAAVVAKTQKRTYSWKNGRKAKYGLDRIGKVGSTIFVPESEYTAVTNVRAAVTYHGKQNGMKLAAAVVVGGMEVTRTA